MSTFVLVHGAWHGGWCWRWVREILETNRHRVVTPTLTGLGERAHLISRSHTLETAVEDVANVLIFEDLRDVILVGHSFAGPVISGVAERAPERIGRLVYLDAALLENAESMLGCLPDELAADRRRLAEETSGGLTLPVPSGAALGVTNAAQWAFLKRYLTPQPLAAYTTPLRLKRLPGAGFFCSYIVCNAPLYAPLAWSRARARDYGWRIIPIETGHDAMISAPDSLSEILMGLGRT
ncbi:MAG: alpha/beta fold hydrolase [Pseudomonadota bacterium]